QQVEQLADAIDTELARGLELREHGANDKRTYRVHKKLGEPCYVCGTPIAQVDFEEHTIYYCPECQTGGRVLKDRRLSRLLRYRPLDELGRFPDMCDLVSGQAFEERGQAGD